MGASLSAVGDKDKAKVLCCVSIGLAHVIFGTLFLAMFGVELWHLYSFIDINGFDYTSAEVWITLLLQVLVILLYGQAVVGHYLSASKMKGLGWARKAAMYVAMSAIVSMIVMTVRVCIQYFTLCDDITDPVRIEEEEICIAVTRGQWIDYGVSMFTSMLILVSFKLMMDAHKSGEEIKRFYGSVWMGRNAMFYRDARMSAISPQGDRNKTKPDAVHWNEQPKGFTTSSSSSTPSLNLPIQGRTNSVVFATHQQEV